MWYFLWKREVVEAHESARRQSQLEEADEAWSHHEATRSAEQSLRGDSGKAADGLSEATQG